MDRLPVCGLECVLYKRECKKTINYSMIRLLSGGWGAIQDIRPAKAAADGSQGMALMSAVVSPEGSLVRGTGAVSVVRSETGVYFVTFDRSTRDCSYFGSIGHAVPDGSTQNVLITANPGPLNWPNAVYVVIRALNSALVDSHFHVQVMCWR